MRKELCRAYAFCEHDSTGLTVKPVAEGELRYVLRVTSRDPRAAPLGPQNDYLD
jgi:hypothetical protein